HPTVLAYVQRRQPKAEGVCENTCASQPSVLRNFRESTVAQATVQEVQILAKLSAAIGIRRLCLHLRSLEEPFQAMYDVVELPTVGLMLVACASEHLRREYLRILRQRITQP